MQRLVAADRFELDRLLEPIARHVTLNLGDHGLDRTADRFAIAVVAEAIHGVAHDKRRFGRVEHDDSLTAGSAAHFDDRPAGGFGELVDVGPGSGTRALAGDRGDDLAVMHLGDPVDGMDDRNRRLAATGHEIDVLRTEMGIAVDRRDRVRTDCRGGEIHHPLAVAEQDFVMAPVRGGRSRVEDDVDFVEMGHGDQSIDALGSDRDAQARAPLESVGGRIDADEGSHLEHGR